MWGVISGFTNVNGRQQANFSQADERFYLHMERRYLPYKKVTELSRELEVLNADFITAYISLIEFLRKSYKEVDLNSYEQ